MAKIVVGVDGSDPSRHALRWAVEEARLRGAEVVALHAYQVVVVPTDVTPVVTLELPSLVTDLRAAAEKIVEDAVREARRDGDVKITGQIVEDTAAEALIEAARDAELLVVGSRGLGELKALLLGSVSHRVVQQATCPVVVHR
ncbi:MAG TPA: universal stress protein [Gaiellaceae bacterium]